MDAATKSSVSHISPHHPSLRPASRPGRCLPSALPPAPPGVLAGILCLLLLLAGCGRDREVTIETDPSGAAIWCGTVLIGNSPQRVTVPRRGTLRLRISHPSYVEQAVDLTSRPPLDGGHMRLVLARKRTLSLDCTSRPVGADVFVDGEYRGKTPMTLADLEPGTVDLTFRAKDRQAVSRTVELEEAGASHSVHVDLPSLAEGYYRQAIREAPLIIANYVDLAHHYMLEGRTADAVGVFREGIRIVLAHPTLESERLWSELQRVVEEQYDYGDMARVKDARRQVLSLLERMVTEEPRASAAVYAAYVYALDAAGERQKAQAAFIKAWAKFPGNPGLQRLQKQKRLQTR